MSDSEDSSHSSEEVDELETGEVGAAGAVGEANENSDDPAKKRANHNELERKRRQAQKVMLQELSRAIPSLRQEKSSAIQVLSHAKEYIDELTKRATELDAEMEAITGGKKPTAVTTSVNSSRTSSPSKGTGKAGKGAGKPTKVNREEETAELESVRKENEGLREKLAVLKRQASSESPTKASRPFTPSQIHVFSPTIASRDLSISPHPASSGTPLPTLLSLATQTEAPASLSLPSHRPRVRSHSESESLHDVSPIMAHSFPGLKPGLKNDQFGGPESSFQANYKKRKSRADNDFEVARREYYSRRNSTVEDLKDQQQRISEVGLLTNFAVQARRASLPSAFLEGFVAPATHDDD